MTSSTLSITPRNPLSFSPSPAIDPSVTGKLTFEAEGIESPGSRFHSRVVHHPSLNSGVTIGRGYDMKLRTRSEIVRDLTAAGVNINDARFLSMAAGLSGDAAERWMTANKRKAPEISVEAQKKLFNQVTYPSYVADTQRLVESWSKVRWQQLGSVQKEFLVDLRYRGDLTKNVFSRIAPAITDGSLTELRDQIYRSGLFGGVPPARQQARLDFISQSVKAVQASAGATWGQFADAFVNTAGGT